MHCVLYNSCMAKAFIINSLHIGVRKVSRPQGLKGLQATRQHRELWIRMCQGKNKKKSSSSLKGRELEKDIRETMSDRTVWNTHLNTEVCACFSEIVLLFCPIVVTDKKNTQLTWASLSGLIKQWPCWPNPALGWFLYSPWHKNGFTFFSG